MLINESCKKCGRKDLIISANILPDYQRELNSRFIRKAKYIVENNLSNESFKFDDFAFDMNVSKSTLYRRIKTITNLSVTEFVFTLRMNKAAQMLEIEQFKIYKVAYTVGFSDPKYFSKCFRKKYGLSPLKYRSLLRKMIR